MLQEIVRIKMEFAWDIDPLENISRNLQSNLRKINNDLHSSADLMIRQFTIRIKNSPKAALVFINRLADKKQIEWSILRQTKFDVKCVIRLVGLTIPPLAPPEE